MPPLLNLGPFSVGAPLGAGAMGTVFAAVHRPTRTPAAVKALHGRFGGADRRAAFRHEVERMAALDHPRIVSIFDHGVIPDDALAATIPPMGPGARERPPPGAPYLVMARAAHGSLAGVAGRLDWPSVAAVLGGILDGLAYAHARGVVHCDLKPENVLLTAVDGIRPALADFGISHAFRDTARTEALGTPPYMAPEQFNMPRDIGPWTDLYALGCLAWSLVCHRLPYEAKSAVGFAVAHTSGERPTPESALYGVPDAMADWLLRLIERDWRSRYRSAAAARAALARFAPLDAEIELPTEGTPLGGLPPTLDGLPPTLVGGLDTTEQTATVDRTPWRPLSGPLPTLKPQPPLPIDWRVPEASRARPLEGAGRALFGLRVAPFTGREAERDRIWAALRAVDRDGRSRAMVLRGAAGTGKSRLAQWIVERADELGGGLPVVLRHHHPPLPGDGLAGALGRVVQPVGDASDAARVARLRGGGAPGADDALIVRLCGDVADGPTVPPSIRHAAAADFLAGIALGRPLLVLIDDAQWATDALAFAQALLDDGPRCLVLLTVRDADAGPLAAIAGRPDAESITLDPLDAATHALLVGRLLPLEPETVDRVVARTAGHPLFAMQLLGEWLARGALQPGRHGFAVSADAADAVPSSLTALWGPRLDALLTDEQRRAVELGAALGLRVEDAPWRAACAAAAVEPAADLLDGLTRAGLVRTERGGWRFAHGLLRDTVLELVTSGQRRRGLHQACAAGLESLPRHRSPAAMIRVAEHWIAADIPAAALGPLRTAAWLLIDRMHRDPVRPLLARHDTLLDALGADVDDPRRTRSGVLRAFLAFADADLDLTRALFDRHRTGIERHGLESERGRLLRLRGMMARQVGDLGAAERLLSAAEQQCLAAGLVVEAGKAALGRSDVLRRLGQAEACQTAIERAERHFSDGGDLFWSNTARMERVRLLRLRGFLAEASALSIDVSEAARRAGDAANEARGLHTHAIIARMRRHLRDAAAALSAAQVIYARTGNINASILDGERGVLAAIEGRFADAGALSARSAAALADTMWADAQPSVFLMQAVAARLAGDTAAADRHLARWSTIPSTRTRADADATEVALDGLLAVGDMARAAPVARWTAETWRAVGEPARADAILTRAGLRPPR